MRAYETELEFSGTKGQAVVVECDKQWRFVFWDKAQYVGCVDLGQGVWFTPEWCETNSPNDLHCYEPIMDKQLKWSKVEILESGPARTRVKWSYTLPDMRYRIFHGNTRAEEIYTIYPDGVAVREVVLWPGTENNHGGNANLWQMSEWILINAAGSNPLDVLEMPTPFTFQNGEGAKIDVPWPLPAQDFEPFCAHYPEVADWPYFIGNIHLKGLPSPFTIICNNQALFPYMPCNHCKGNHPYFNLFPGKNLYNVYKHWPVTDMEDFIQWVPAGDDIGKVATHTSFVDVNFAMRRSARDYIPTPDLGTTWYMLVGATTASGRSQAEQLAELAHSYQHPAAIEICRDEGEPEDLHRGRVLLEGYDYALRAYVIRKQGEDRVSLTMTPSSAQLYPVFIVTGWSSADVVVSRNGRPLSSTDYQSQQSGDELIIWVGCKVTEAATFEIVGRG